jgi:hypothetical protein
MGQGGAKTIVRNELIARWRTARQDGCGVRTGRLRHRYERGEPR